MTGPRTSVLIPLLATNDRLHLVSQNVANYLQINVAVIKSGNYWKEVLSIKLGIARPTRKAGKTAEISDEQEFILFGHQILWN